MAAGCRVADDGGMHHTDTPPFTRPRNGRVVTGAASAVAARLGISPTLTRFGFVAASVAGGIGIVAYLLITVATRSSDADRSPFQEWIASYDRTDRLAPRVGWWILTALMLAGVAATSFLQGPFVLLGLIALGAWLMHRPEPATVSA